MQRAIEGFHLDALGDWVADLRCGHGQHVLTEAGRSSRVGVELDCVRCDQFEIPDGFVPYKRTIEFDERSVPPALLADHSTKPGVWGLIHVVDGELTYVVGPPLARELQVDAAHPAVIAPEVVHFVRPGPAVRFFVEFHQAPSELHR